MISSVTRHSLLLTVFVSLGIMMSGCAAKGTPPAGKVGMHFDAVLEFVVEYPLAWKKDRRLPYGSDSGEVRWTNPEHPDVLLKITSAVDAGYPGAETGTAGFTVLGYPDLEIASQEKITLPAGEAAHIEGKTRSKQVDIYQISKADRTYSIAFTKPIEDTTNYKKVIERVVESFRTLSNPE